jgi:methyl-accepting chemotaxis protein
MASFPTFPVFAAVLLQATWVGPTVALSLVVIALSFLALAVAVARMGKGAVDAMEHLSKELAEVRDDLRPALRSLREVAEDGREVATHLREEVRSVVASSQRIRHDVDRGFRRAKRRLEDLDALAEVVQDEIEDTALDVTATLRGVRRGAGMVNRLRRLVRRGRR